MIMVKIAIGLAVLMMLVMVFMAGYLDDDKSGAKRMAFLISGTYAFFGYVLWTTLP